MQNDQCMDLAVDYVYHITNNKVRMYGNAKDSILNIFPKGWKIVKNTTDYIPPVGAIGVCTYGIYQRYGHIYLVWDNSGGTNTQTVLEQNFDGNADTPAKLRVDNFYGTTHYIVPSFVDEDYDVNKIKTVTTRKATNKYNGKQVPKNLVWSKTPHYIAKADSSGVTICKDVKNGYMKKTNLVYKAGYSPFYVYEVREGWARVYSESSNYWVWHERLIITKEYKHNETRDGKKASKQTKEMKKIANKSKNKLSVGQIPPKRLSWQRKKYFEARADSFGATILNRHGGKGNYSWNMTNTTYGKGQLFYVYEIIDGWCRVHGPSDNYWVWHERLRITKVY